MVIISNIECQKISSRLPMNKDEQAMQMFEKAVHKESQGSMSDAVSLYRQAFKLNDKIDLLYRSTTIAKSKQQPTIKLDEEVIKSINVDELIESCQHAEINAPRGDEKDLVIKIGDLVLDDKPVSPLIKLSNDIWLYIIEILIQQSPESWINLSLMCKRFSYLGFQPSIYRYLANLIYPLQIYEENQPYEHRLNPKHDDDLPVPKDQLKILPNYQNSWKYMINHRPFIKFNGCYISVINYYSEGGRPEFSSSWTNPVKTITYYRYLRFYTNGTVLKVLTPLEPNRVIPHLSLDNTVITSTIDQIKGIKDGHKIYRGRWTMNIDGGIHIVIDEGSVPYYIFHYHFNIKNMGQVKFGKLAWDKYYTVRKHGPEEDIGEVSMLGLKNEKPFKFLRVKSYEPNHPNNDVTIDTNTETIT